MNNVSFEIDYIALLLSLPFIFIAFILKRQTKQFPNPTLLFSSLNDFPRDFKSRRQSFSRLPSKLDSLALLCFLLAFIDPHFFKEKLTKDTLPKEGIAIYLVTDQSGSMKEKVFATLPDGKTESLPKINLLKSVTTEFVAGNGTNKLAGRKNDLIGLIAFARTAHVLVPLTLDHNAILKALRELQPVSKQDEDGTALGYALYKAANIISATRHYNNDLESTDIPSYEIKNAIIILITDGFNDPSILDKDNPLRNISPLQAAEFAKKQGIRTYIVNVDPKLGTETYAAHRRLMQQVAELTGGKFYMMNEQTSLNQIYADIDLLEKSTLPENLLTKENQPYNYQRISLYPFLIAVGLIALFASILLRTSILRVTP